MENGRKRFVPYWLRWSEEPLQKDVLLILERCNAIRRLTIINGDGDEADREGARVDLQDVMAEIFNRNGGNREDNPLWSAIMMIRPQVISSRLPISITEEVAQALWTLRGEAGEKEPVKTEFFGRLAGRLRKHQINFFRAVIAGGMLVAKEKNGEWQNHYFSGIPFPVRMEAGVKLSTAPENVEAVIKAYKTMAEKTSGHAKTAIEAVIADIQNLSERLYSQQKK